jgi:hypothetical protein
VLNWTTLSKDQWAELLVLLEREVGSGETNVRLPYAVVSTSLEVCERLGSDERFYIPVSVVVPLIGALLK